MSDYYKTGDITLSDSGYLRIYIREDDTQCGFFLKLEGKQSHFFKHVSDSVALVKNTSEPVITTLDDVMEAIRAAYGKEIR
jgi:hypothetical protein